MANLSIRRKRLIVTVLSLGATVFFLLCAELFLKLFFPFPRPVTIGHVAAPNALLYGWGYYPRESVSLFDPDTGAPIECRLNGQGWKDHERAFENPDSAYRILILGDSVTFGAIVGTEDTYGILLEKKLRSAGYNAEVISLGYGGWGTDQELEALIHEGIRYRPDLVIDQFCANDIEDNVRPPETKQLKKPFFYTLDEAGGLVRNQNPTFPASVESAFFSRDTLRRLFLYSEIYKRIRAARSRSSAPPATGPITRYKITAQALDRVSESVSGAASAKFLEDLRRQEGREVSREVLEDAVRANHLESHSELILRMCEDRWFQYGWSREAYRPSSADPGSPAWRLYFRLVERLRDVAAGAKAALVIFSETDRASYEWNGYWGRVAPGDRYFENYLSATRRVQEFAEAHGIGFVPQARPYVRARNDSHANAAGNQAMADDLYDYLMSTRKVELEKRRSTGSRSPERR